MAEVIQDMSEEELEQRRSVAGAALMGVYEKGTVCDPDKGMYSWEQTETGMGCVPTNIQLRRNY